MRSCRSLGISTLALWAALAVTGAAAGQETAAEPTPWHRLGLQLAEALRAADPALPAGAPPGAAAAPDDVARWLHSVLSAWRASPRRAVAGGADAADGDGAPPTVVVDLVRRLAHRLDLAERSPAPDAALLADVRALRLVVAKHRRRATPPRPAPVRVAAALAPPNDACATATAIGDGTAFESTAQATSDGSSSCDDPAGAPDVWFLYTATAGGEVSFDTSFTDFDTVVSLHSGCPGTTANELACNDDHLGLQSRVSRTMTAGEQVRVRVAGTGGVSGLAILEVEAGRRISGNVTDDTTGDPVAGVQLHVFDSEGTFQGAATSGAGGVYATPVLPDGDYFVRTVAPGYLDELYDDLPCDLGCEATDGTPVPLAPGANGSGTDFELSSGAALSGTVTDAGTGEPLAGLRVDVSNGDDVFLESVSTADDGTYTVAGLPEGDVFVNTRTDEYLDEIYDDVECPFVCPSDAGTPVAVVTGSERTGVDFALVLGGKVSGRVRDAATAAPLSEIGMNLSSTDAQSGRDNRDDGSYSFGGLPSGTYFVHTQSDLPDELWDDLPCEPFCTPQTGTPITVVEGLETGGIDFELGINPTIEGTVTEAGTGLPLAGVPVTAYDLAGRPLAGTMTAANGHYSLTATLSDFRLLAGPALSHATRLAGGLPFGLDVRAGAALSASGPAGADGVDFVLPPLGACRFPETLRISSLAVLSAAEFAACGDLEVGPGVTVEGGGRVALRAGGTVALHDGVAVASGASLTVSGGSALPPPAGDVLYREDFEDGFALGWDTSNGAGDLWRIDQGCAQPPVQAAALSFSRSAPDCDYQLFPALPQGWARSPLIDLSAATSATLVVDHAWETDADPFFDVKRIEASADGGATWTPVWTGPGGASTGWAHDELDVSAFATATFRFRFVFDAVDFSSNHLDGWHVDEVSVRAE